MAKRGSMLAAVAQAWHAYALQATTAINSSVIVSSSSGSEKHGSGLESMEFATSVRVLCDQGLAHLVLSYFLDALEVFVIYIIREDCLNGYHESSENQTLKEIHGYMIMQEMIFCTIFC